MGELRGSYVGELKIESKWKIGVVTSRFNAQVTERLEHGAMERLTTLGFAPEQVLQVKVPGAVEIPLAAKFLLEQGMDAVVTLGAVIRGETDHYDYVCNSVERGCTLLQLEYSKPVGFGILTTENKEQAMARSGGSKGHKGMETVEVVVEMLNLKKQLGF